MSQGRTDKSIKNIKYALIGQVANLVTSFIARAIFINILGDVFLGANGVFTNIISILSLAELGIGPALIFALYEPIVKDDKERIKQIMHLYKVSYIAIGLIIMVSGLLFSPFLGYFIKEDLPGTSVFLAFMMFVLTSAVSYFYSYKSSLLIADQKRYIVVKYQYGFYLIISILQIIVLYLTRDYIFYLVTKLVLTFMEHYLVSLKADKEYPYLKEPVSGKLDGETKNGIVKNIKAMVIHKIGAVLVLSTDNLIISRMLGLIIVGIYSNYTLITNALTTLIEQIFTSLVASVGNFRVTESNERSIEVFNIIYFIGFWIYGFSCICLLCMFNPFIDLFFGSEFIFSLPIVLTIVFNFYFTGMRNPTNSYKQAYGLYWQNRYVPIFEITINLVTSIILCKYIGVAGVFLGTIISTLSTCFWVEPYILYKHGFKSSMAGYMLTYAKYTAVSVLTGAGCYWLCSHFSYSFLGFAVRLFICMIFPNAIFVILFRHTKEYKTVKEIVMKKIIRRNIVN